MNTPNMLSVARRSEPTLLTPAHSETPQRVEPLSMLSACSQCSPHCSLLEAPTIVIVLFPKNVRY